MVKMDWFEAKDVRRLAKTVVARLDLNYIDLSRITFYRSLGSVSRARARIWGLPRVWQMALIQKPHYIIEVIARYYDKMSEEEKTKTIIHEMMHIPKNFSGALLSHSHRGGKINHTTVSKLYEKYKKG